LTSLFNNATFEISAVPITPSAEETPKKRGWLPLLTVLFLISYGLMTMLIVEQGQTIESQRALIQELFRDSSELSALRHAQIAAAREAAQASTAKAPSAQIPSTQTPSTQIQSKQTPSNQTPSNQAGTKTAPSSQAQPQVQKESKKPEFKMPSRPASDLSDENRALITI
jgi:cell division septation protein DedD